MKITKKAIEQAEQYCAPMFKSKSETAMFYELCFCISSPQTKWSTNIKVNKELRGLKLFSLPISSSRLERIIKPLRFYKNKTRYLLEAKKQWKDIYRILISTMSPTRKRKWLVDNVKGLGMKTSSHLLRNSIGVSELAILDTHLLKFLNFEGFPNVKQYLELERNLKCIADTYKISVMVLDAIIFLKGSNAEYLR